MKPPALRAGESVGIVAPAGPVDPELLARGCDALRALGYVPVYNDSIVATDLYFAGSVERRARELETMFAREDVCAIICARGGYGCNCLLGEINLDIIRRNPKIFVGYSDITTLLTWFHDATGLVTFHGPMLTKDFAVPHGVDLPSWEAKVGGKTEVQSAALLTPITTGMAQGKLYGGCLSLLAASLGTPYEIRTDGTVLLIEDVNAYPYQIDRMLMQLKLAGKLASVRGVVFGLMRGCEPAADANYTLIDVIRRAVGNLDVPVAYGLNTGHVERGNLTMALGVHVSLKVEREFAAIATLEPAVSSPVTPAKG
ncbi:MAG: LD-carboxypeptidase [Terriglobales bacterium]